MNNSLPVPCTIGELLERLGHVPPWRVRMHPTPGTATVQDVVDVRNRDRHLCELVDGTLVEKGAGFRESILAGAISSLLQSFVIQQIWGL